MKLFLAGFVVVKFFVFAKYFLIHSFLGEFSVLHQYGKMFVSYMRRKIKDWFLIDSLYVKNVFLVNLRTM